MLCDQYWKTEPNHTSGKIKLTPLADCHTTVLLVLSLKFSQPILEADYNRGGLMVLQRCARLEWQFLALLFKKNLLSVLHDQCSNMELARDILHQETGNCQSYSCATHHLKLCIEESLHITVISEALTVAKKLVAHF